MTDGSRRFTDREVALVLKRASEIEEVDGSGAGGGLSLDDLKEIAREVGISESAISQAVSGLAQRRGSLPGPWGAPLARRAVHAVQGELNTDAIAKLIRRVDEETDSAGSVSEALGSVRWTGADRFRSTRISITPANGETTIQVEEKAVPRMRRIFNLVPGAWAAILAMPVITSAGGLSTAQGAMLVGLSVAAGIGVGRAVWNLMSASSARRVERLAAALSKDAHDAAQAGLLAPASDSAES